MRQGTPSSRHLEDWTQSLWIDCIFTQSATFVLSSCWLFLVLFSSWQQEWLSFPWVSKRMRNVGDGVERQTEYSPILSPGLSCGVRLEPFSFREKDLRMFVSRSIWVLIGRLIMMGNTAVQSLVTMARSSTLWFTPNASYHPSLPRQLSGRSQASAKSAKLANASFWTGLHNRTRREFRLGSSRDKNLVRKIRRFTHWLSIVKAEQQMVASWSSLREGRLSPVDPFGQR